jgi:hypothetical protein
MRWQVLFVYRPAVVPGPVLHMPPTSYTGKRLADHQPFKGRRFATVLQPFRVVPRSTFPVRLARIHYGVST